MENEFYHSRLDKAKEALMASRKDEGENEHKKKKKHKDERPSRSASRDKKKRDRSRSRSEKHKKHHKHRDSHERRHRYSPQPDRHVSDERHRKGRREDDRGRDRDSYRDRDRDQKRKKEQKITDQKDPYYQKRRQIERIRRTDPVKAEEMETQLEKQIIFDHKEKEVQDMRQKFKQAQKQMEEAKREDMTILVYCLPLKAKEKDIWNFFSKTNCGKIRDIRIIRDARSGRSKGVAYVEFYNAESVQRALTMSDMPFQLKGRQFMGLRVQHSQAEKNRAAAVARTMKVYKPADPIQQQQQQIRRQTKVVVSGLTDKLAEISQKDLKELFEPYGEIDYVDIQRDPQTGQCKGYAFIQYVDPEKAKIAVKEMNGLRVTGDQKINVQIITLHQKGEVPVFGGDDPHIHSEGNRARMMGLFSGQSTGPSYANLHRPPISTVTTPYLIMTGMFKMEGTTPGYFDNLKKDIQKEVDQYGVVERIFIEKNNQGNIWIKYSDTASASKAQSALNLKLFDGHKIFMYFVTENTYQARVGI